MPPKNIMGRLLNSLLTGPSLSSWWFLIKTFKKATETAIPSRTKRICQGLIEPGKYAKSQDFKLRPNCLPRVGKSVQGALIVG